MIGFLGGKLEAGPKTPVDTQDVLQTLPAEPGNPRTPPVGELRMLLGFLPCLGLKKRKWTVFSCPSWAMSCAKGSANDFIYTAGPPSVV